MSIMGLRRGEATAIAILSMGLAGCGQIDDGATNSGNVQLYSWWVSGGEKDALQAVLDIHNSKYPNVTIQNLTGTNADTARDNLAASMQSASPPDTYQVNIGQDLMKWVYSNGVDTTESPLGPIDNWVKKDVFHADISKQVSAKGGLWAVPVNLHRINSLFFNKNVFKQLGIREPWEGMTFDEFLALCDELKKNVPPDVAPLALGNAKYWTLEELVFEDILPGVAGGAYYTKFWQGQGNPDGPQITETLQNALRLLDYINITYNSIDWTEALDLVMGISGAAAVSPSPMAAAGDWAKGYFEYNGWKADSEFGVVQFPSKSKVFVYTADCFPLTIKDTNSHERAAELLQTFASEEAQVAFNHRKGSIPARQDIVLEDYPDFFDAMNRRTRDAWLGNEHALAISGVVPSGLLSELSTTLRDSFRDRSITLVQTYLRNNYATLTKYAQPR